jgi:hypothetical protein
MEKPEQSHARASSAVRAACIQRKIIHIMVIYLGLGWTTSSVDSELAEVHPEPGSYTDSQKGET